MCADELKSSAPRAQRVLTRNLPQNYHPTRAGVIPYTVSSDRSRIFYLCIDANYGDLTNASGGTGTSESPIIGAVRELYEETIGIFDFRNAIETIQNQSVSIYTPRELIIIQPVRLDTRPAQVCHHYRELYRSALDLGVDNRHIESAYLVYISEENLLALIRGETVSIPEDLRSLDGIKATYPPLYHRLRGILNTTGTELF